MKKVTFTSEHGIYFVITLFVLIIVFFSGQIVSSPIEATLPTLYVKNNDFLTGVFTLDVMMAIVFIFALALVAIAVSIYQRRDDP